MDQKQWNVAYEKDVKNTTVNTHIFWGFPQISQLQRKVHTHTQSQIKSNFPTF